MKGQHTKTGGGREFGRLWAGNKVEWTLQKWAAACGRSEGEGRRRRRTKEGGRARSDGELLIPG